MAVFHLQAGFEKDMTAEGWVLESDSPEPIEFSPEIIPCIKEDSITGGELERRAKRIKSLAGQRHLESMAKDDAFLIRWRKTYPVGMGTVWVTPSGLRMVPYLACHVGRVYFRQISNDFQQWYVLVSAQSEPKERRPLRSLLGMM